MVRKRKQQGESATAEGTREEIREADLEVAHAFERWVEEHMAEPGWWAGLGILAAGEMTAEEKVIMDRLSPLMHYMQARQELYELHRMGVLTLERAAWMLRLWSALRRAKLWRRAA